MAESDFKTAAVILAGGASSRMGAPKPFMPLSGRCLIERVLDRLEPQVARTYVNPREADERFAALRRPLVLDPPRWRGAGPLAGIAAAIAQARQDGARYLVTAPCDAPFLPENLVSRLLAPLAAGAAPAAVALSEFGLEPMFALWPTDSLELIQQALESGRSSPRRTLETLEAAQVRFPPAGRLNPFANVNTREELAAAEAALARFPAISPARSSDQIQGDGE